EESGRYYADVPALWMLLTQSRCVISVQDLFFKRVSALVRVMGIERFRNPETVRRFVLIASKAIGVRHGVNSVSGPVLYCTSESLLPVRLYPCRLITKEDIPALKEAGLYDSSLDYSIEQGTCFAAFDQDQPVSLAGTYPVPHMAELVAEIAVPGTIATHRRLGYGRTALSSTTEAVLNQNRVPVYITSDQNMASQDTAKAVGYRLYGWQFRIRLVRPDIDTQRRAF
ncbi:MAG: GNAT family N-acetyltransferase, partial [candidate division WOR-3 bacterium]